MRILKNDPIDSLKCDNIRIMTEPYSPPDVEDQTLAEIPAERYITCQICQTTISLKSFKARVVKCPRCKEGNV